MNLLQAFLDNLNLSENASKLIKDIWNLFQEWDDVRDNNISSEEALKIGVIELPCNPLYGPYGIACEIAKAHSKWEVSNYYESNNINLDKSYMLRAVFYDLALHIYYCEKGTSNLPEAAVYIYDSYGETLEELKEEFKNG